MILLNTSIPQKKLRMLVESLGFRVEEEKKFYPYYVDVYIQEVNVGVELDGPYHIGKSRDLNRDKFILDNYGIKILRVKQKELKDVKKVEKKIIEFIEANSKASQE